MSYNVISLTNCHILI